MSLQAHLGLNMTLDEVIVKLCSSGARSLFSEEGFGAVGAGRWNLCGSALLRLFAKKSSLQVVSLCGPAF